MIYDLLYDQKCYFFFYGRDFKLLRSHITSYVCSRFTNYSLVLSHEVLVYSTQILRQINKVFGNDSRSLISSHPYRPFYVRLNIGINFYFWVHFRVSLSFCSLSVIPRCYKSPYHHLWMSTHATTVEPIPRVNK